MTATVRPRRGGRFWSVNELAQVLEISVGSVIAAAKITGKVVMPGGLIWFARRDGQPSRPGRDFIGEAHRANLASQRQQARRAECRE